MPDVYQPREDVLSENNVVHAGIRRIPAASVENCATNSPAAWCSGREFPPIRERLFDERPLQLAEVAV